MTTSPADGPSSTSPDPWDELLEGLLPAVSAALVARGIGLTPAAVGEALDRGGGEHGDLALALHRVAKGSGSDPATLAQQVAASLGPVRGLRQAKGVGAFLNFSVDPGWLTGATLRRVFARGAAWGQLPTTTTTACVEHTSANPTGPFHVGRVRNGIIGDTLARILRASGVPVTTQYYVDDVGRQAAMVAWIWAKPVGTWPPEIRAALPNGEDDPNARADQRYGRPYAAVSRYLKEHPDAAAEVTALSRELEGGHGTAERHALVAAVLDGMVASLARIGIRFDEFVWESSFVTSGDVERVVGRIRAAPHAVTEANGALALDTSSYGLPKESAHVIVTRADGSTLYAVRDIAYHLAKFGRFDRVIDVLGQDHHLHAKTLDAMLNEIGERRRPEFVIYQDITVPEGGRMSTRGGKVVYLDDLLDEAIERARAEVRQRRESLDPAEVETIARSIGAAAVRYHIVRVAPEKAVAFRWEDALSFEGRSGPFLQYSYARACSLLRKAGDEATSPTYLPDQLGTTDELELVKEISRFPGVVAYVARTTHVHALAGYGYQLAERFNRFYESTPVLTAGSEKVSRIALVAATRQTLGNVLALLGLDAPERM